MTEVQTENHRNALHGKALQKTPVLATGASANMPQVPQVHQNCVRALNSWTGLILNFGCRAVPSTNYSQWIRPQLSKSQTSITVRFGESLDTTWPPRRCHFVVLIVVSAILVLLSLRGGKILLISYPNVSITS